MSRSLLFPLIALSLSACTGSTFYHSYKPLPKEGWERHDTVCFDLPKAGQDIDGTLIIGLRTAAHTPMQDIVLAVEQCFDAPPDYVCDTVRYPLTDDEGYALAKGVNHHQYEDRQLPLQMKKGQSGSVRIRHLMTHELMTGITEVGIRKER